MLIMLVAIALIGVLAVVVVNNVNNSVEDHSEPTADEIVKAFCRNSRNHNES